MTRRQASDAGYGVPELLVGTVIVLVVTGAAGVLATGVQRIATSVDAEQAARMDARFTVDSIVRTIEQAGSMPYGAPRAVCGGGHDVAPLVLDPNGDGGHDAVRVRMDVNPPNALLGGIEGRCDDSGEDVTIGFDRRAGVVTRRDAVSGGGPVAISSARVVDLRFRVRDAEGLETAVARDAASVEVELTVRADGAFDRRVRVFRAVARLREQ